MSRAGDGTYTLPLPDVVAGDDIEASWANTTMDDIAAEMQDSLSRSGKGGMSAALKLASGTVSAPGLSFTSEANSGSYRASAGDIRGAVGGADIWRMTSAGFQVYVSASPYNVVPTGVASTIDGVKTFSSDPLIPDEAYGSGWNGSLEPPTKNAVYDKIEAATLYTGPTQQWIPVKDMFDYAGGTGPAALSTLLGGDYQYRAFDDASLEELSIVTTLPAAWNGGSVSAYIYWAAGGAGNCRWVIRDIQPVGDGESLASLGGYNAASNATSPASTTTLEITGPLTLSVTSPSNRDLLKLALGRSGANVGDTLTGDALLIGMLLEWTNT